MPIRRRLGPGRPGRCPRRRGVGATAPAATGSAPGVASPAAPDPFDWLAPSGEAAKALAALASDLRPNSCFFSQANCRLSASICWPYQPIKTTNEAMVFSAARNLCFHCSSRWTARPCWAR